MLLLNKIKLLFIFLLATSLVTLVYIQTTVYSTKQYQSVLRKLELIDEKSVFLNEQVLKAHKGLLKNNDDLTLAVRKMRSMASGLTQSEIKSIKREDVQQLELKLASLSLSLDYFLSINAILNNALSYLPLLVNEFDIQSEYDRKTTEIVYHLLEQTYLYNRWQESHRRLNIERLINQLSAHSMSYEPDKSSLLGTIIANSRVALEHSDLIDQNLLSQKRADLLTTIIIHTRIILEYSNQIDEQIKEILSYAISDNISLIRQQHIAFSSDKYQQARYLNWIIFVIAAVLLLMVFNFVLTLRSFSRSLHTTNEKLRSEIEQRTTAESKQKAESIFLQTILDNISDGIVVCDNNGVLCVFNKAAEKIYGQRLVPVDVEQWAQQYRLYDKQGLHLLNKEQLPLYITLTKGNVNNAEVMVKPVSAAEKILLINGAQIINDEGEKQGAVICLRDITERKKADVEMRLAATAFEANEAIMIVDAHFRIVRVNNKFTEITGFSVEDVIGKKADILQSDKHDQAFYQKLWKAVYEKGYWQGEIYSQRKNGEDYLEWMSMSVVKNEHDEITHYISHFGDITEYKQQQEQIKRYADEERLLAEILQLSFLSMNAFLKQFAELIVSLPWLKLESKCGIGLKHDRENCDGTTLVCNKNLTKSELKVCVQEWLEKYVCGDLVHSGEVHFSVCIGGYDDPGNPESSEHNHYYVPIVSGDKVLGVVVLYLSPHHQQQEYEVSFLKRVADVLSLGIARKRAEEEVEYLAYHDGLTALPNRRLLMNRLEQVISANKRQNRYAALIYIDFDRFKHINDTLGHSVGDGLLQEVASRFKRVIRQEDTVARIGGDEFVVLLTEIPPNRDSAISEVQLIANKLHHVISKEINIQNHSLYISLSMGVVIISGEEENTETIMTQADTAMYQAKESGRNSTRFFKPEMQMIANARMELEKDLQHALEYQEIKVFYQPQTNIKGELVGAEALIRWIHPKRGMVAPGEFISIAEDSRIMLDIGRYVLEDACEKIKQWKSTNLEHIAVNISPFQFKQPDFVEGIEQIILKKGIDTSKLTLELTEAVLVENVEDVIDKMQGLKKLGIRFSIDDFGIGYSSLANLIRFPIDQLKIDQSFVGDIGIDKNDRIIIQAIIAIAERLELSLIAEGVETSEQIKFLKEQGCVNYQGYYFSKPLTGDEFSSIYV